MCSVLNKKNYSTNSSSTSDFLPETAETTHDIYDLYKSFSQNRITYTKNK